MAAVKSIEVLSPGLQTTIQDPPVVHWIFFHRG